MREYDRLTKLKRLFRSQREIASGQSIASDLETRRQNAWPQIKSQATTNVILNQAHRTEQIVVQDLMLSQVVKRTLNPDLVQNLEQYTKDLVRDHSKIQAKPGLTPPPSISEAELGGYINLGNIAADLLLKTQIKPLDDPSQKRLQSILEKMRLKREGETTTSDSRS